MGPELALGEAVARLLLVLVLAGAVGVEREVRDQDAGLRTHMLVGVGATLFVIAGNYAWSGLEFGSARGIVLDPSRVVAYVVTGVGFLGAGAILKNGASVRGLTTAASLWVVAAVGVVVGSGEYWLGVVATTILLLSLWPVRKIADLLGLRSRRSRLIRVDLAPEGRVADVIRLITSVGLDVLTTKVRQGDDARHVVVAVSGSAATLTAALDDLVRDRHVRGASIEM